MITKSKLNFNRQWVVQVCGQFAQTHHQSDCNIIMCMRHSTNCDFQCCVCSDFFQTKKKK